MFYPRVTYLVRVLLSKIVIVLLLVSLVSTVGAQNEVKQKYQSNLDDWRDGSVQTNNGTIIEGQVRYNWLENIVTIKNEEVTRTFNAQGIQRFDMEGISGLRHFISSPKESTIDEKATSYFFEVLVECKHFAFMMQRDIYASENTNSNPSIVMSNAKTKEVVVKKLLYFFDDEGNINLYLSSTEVEVMGLAGFFSGKKPTSKIVNKNLMSRYLGDRYVEVKEYAKKNSLSFWDRNDLVTILTYFKKLESL